jgi:hypothetical protein
MNRSHDADDEQSATITVSMVDTLYDAMTA